MANPASSGGDAISPTRRAATEGGSLRRPSEISHLAQRRSRIVFRQVTTVDSKPKAWEIAAETARKSADLFEKSAAASSGKARALLEDLAKEDRALAAEAGKELAELRS